jgi:thiol-disulfide isomerase/thioredoxin
MLVLFLLALQLNISLENQAEFTRLSPTVPTFLMLYSRYCGHCLEVLPTFDEFMRESDADPNILVAECEVNGNRDFASSIGHVHHYPGLVVYINGRSRQIQTNFSPDHLFALADKVKRLDPSIPSEPDLNQTDGFPYLKISSSSDDRTTCRQITALSADISIPPNHFLIGTLSNETYQFFLSETIFFTFPGSATDPNFASVAQDFLRPTLGDFPLTDFHFFKHRRFGAVVFSDESQLRRVDQFAISQSQDYVFGQWPADDFHAVYPELLQNESWLPAVALFNHAKTHFGLLAEIRFSSELRSYFSDLKFLMDESEMTIPFEGFFAVWEVPDSSFVWKMLALGICLGSAIAFVGYLCLRSPERLQYYLWCVRDAMHGKNE